MTPQEAAHSFLELVVRMSFGNALDLSDPTWFRDDLAARTHLAAYQQVESAVRQRYRLTYDLDALEQAVREAAPAEHQSAVVAALKRFGDAVNDELIVKQAAAYVVGIAIGAALDPSLTCLLGEGWTLPDPPPTATGPRRAGLAIDVVIVRENAPGDPDRPYVVWFTGEGAPSEDGMVVGHFATFDAATASILAVKGLRLGQIRTEGIKSDGGER